MEKEISFKDIKESINFCLYGIDRAPSLIVNDFLGYVNYAFTTNNFSETQKHELLVLLSQEQFYFLLASDGSTNLKKECLNRLSNALNKMDALRSKSVNVLLNSLADFTEYESTSGVFFELCNSLNPIFNNFPIDCRFRLPMCKNKNLYFQNDFLKKALKCFLERTDLGVVMANDYHLAKIFLNLYKNHYEKLKSTNIPKEGLLFIIAEGIKYGLVPSYKKVINDVDFNGYTEEKQAIINYFYSKNNVKDLKKLLNSKDSKDLIAKYINPVEKFKNLKIEENSVVSIAVINSKVLGEIEKLNLYGIDIVGMSEDTKIGLAGEVFKNYPSVKIIDVLKESFKIKDDKMMNSCFYKSYIAKISKGNVKINNKTETLLNYLIKLNNFNITKCEWKSLNAFSEIVSSRIEKEIINRDLKNVNNSANVDKVCKIKSKRL